MNKIKGLIIKDLLQLKSYKKTLIVFIFVFVATSIAQENSRNLLTVMLTLGLGMFSIATFSYDEMAKADKYILTLPLTKKEVVLGKYLLVIISTILGSILGVIASSILELVTTGDQPNFLELIELAIGSIFGIGIVESIQVPFIYKYGAEKGRIQIFIAIAAVAFLLGGILWLGEKYGVNFLDMNINAFMKLLPIVLVMATAIVYFVSFKISYKIYEKKEM